jgi:hypothetical protein
MVVLGQALTKTPEGCWQKTEKQVNLSYAALRQGKYVIGTPGTGKTSLLINTIEQHMNDPEQPGICMLDPHGDMTDELLERVPRHRIKDVVLFAPGDKRDQAKYPLGLNLLACSDPDDPDERELVSSTVISTLYKLFFYSWGPRMEDLLRSTILSLMEKPGATLLDVWLLLASKLEQEDFAPQVQDPYFWRYWNTYFAGLNDKEKLDIAGSSLNKIGRFLGNPTIRNIVGQPKNAFDMNAIMKSGGILFVNLSKGRLGEDNTALLGAVLVNMLLVATLKRQDTPKSERRPFHLIVDEYQSFATESFPTLQSEARKYGVTITVAHQYRDQLDDLNKGSTLNVANFICLRVSGQDSAVLAEQFDNTPPEPDTVWEAVRHPYQQADLEGYFWPDDKIQLPVPGVQRSYGDMSAERANTLSLLPNYQALCRIVEDGNLVEYRVALDNPDAKPPTPEEQRERQAIAKRIREQSRERGRHRSLVEAAIKKRLGVFPPDLPDARK